MYESTKKNSKEKKFLDLFVSLLRDIISWEMSKSVRSPFQKRKS
jgi:hypothetical protein